MIIGGMYKEADLQINITVKERNLSCDFDLQGEMIGKGTFQQLSKSGIDFSSLLKHDEEEDRPASPTLSQIMQRSVSHDPQTKSPDQHGRLSGVLSKSHENISSHLTEVRQRVRVDSTLSRHSVHESMLSLASLETDFEVNT